MVRCERRGVALFENSESGGVVCPNLIRLVERMLIWSSFIGWDDPPVAYDSVDFASGEYVDLVPLRISDRVRSQRDANGDLSVSGVEVIECLDLVIPWARRVRCWRCCREWCMPMTRPRTHLGV